MKLLFGTKKNFVHFRVVLFAKMTPLREKESFAHFRVTGYLAIDVSDWMIMLKQKYIFLSSKSKNHFSLNSYTGDCQMHLFYDVLGPKMKSVILKQACGGFFQNIKNQ